MCLMRKAIVALFFLTVSLLAHLIPASAAPPASCVRKFVGTWSITVLATGQRYTSQIRADGTLTSACPLCPASQTWTCNGNSFILLSPVSLTSTLSADGKRMVSGCCTSARIGGAAIAADSTTKDGATRQAAAPQSKEWQTCSNGSAEQAIAACSTLIQTRMSGGKKLHPDDVGWAFGTRALHYAAQRNHSRAMADVEDSIRLRMPKNLMFAYYVRGLVHQNQNDHHRAIADFTKAVEINPKTDVAFAARGKSHLILGNSEEGNADYERAILASPASRARYDMEREFLVDWLQYLKEIQDAGDHANWSAAPLKAYRVPGG